MANYDTTKYREKESHGPDPGTKEFGDQARIRHARLMEDAINGARPDPRNLGTGTARQAGDALKRRREQIERAED